MDVQGGGGDYSSIWCRKLHENSCFEKGCLTNGEKLTRHCRKLLWVMGFTLAWVNLMQGASGWWKETAQTSIRSFSFLVAESPWTSIKQNQTLTSHNANRHCRVRFYTFVGQPFSKQLYKSQRFLFFLMQIALLTVIQIQLVWYCFFKWRHLLKFLTKL